MVRVTVWGENVHEGRDESVRAIYPEGMHATIASGLIDSITNPLLGSRAAVKTSERNRVVGDASTAIVTTEQADLPINSLKEGMTTMEVRELLGEPQRIDPVPEGGPNRFRWTYTKVGRILTMQDNKIAAIEIIR